MKTIKETYPNIKENDILIDKDKTQYKIESIDDYSIWVTNQYQNLYTFNVKDIKQMKLKIKNTMKTFESELLDIKLNKLEQRIRLTNFLNDDLNQLQELLNNESNELKEELQRFIYYWQQHSKTFKD